MHRALWVSYILSSITHHEALPTPKKISESSSQANSSPGGKGSPVNKQAVLVAWIYLPFYMFAWCFTGGQSTANERMLAHCSSSIAAAWSEPPQMPHEEWPLVVTCPGQCEKLNSCKLNKTLKFKGPFPWSCYISVVHSRWLSKSNRKAF